MHIFSRSVGIFAVSALVLSGCSNGTIVGGPVSSAEGCRVNWEQARASSSDSATADQELRTCLERFGIEDPNAYLRNPSAYAALLERARLGEEARLRSVPVSPCPAGSAVMIGGARYCVGLK